MKILRNLDCPLDVIDLPRQKHVESENQNMGNFVFDLIDSPPKHRHHDGLLSVTFILPAVLLSSFHHFF